MTPEQRFAANLRALRKESGHSQEGLSYLAGMDHGRVGHYEQGKVIPRALGLVRLAGALGATTDDLLGGIEWRREKERLVVRGEDA